MSVNAFVQARLSSSRLPGKVLKLLAGKPVLKHVIDRVSQADFIDNVVVLTSTDPTDDAIEAFCQEAGYAYFRGDLDDVLGRFNSALLAFPCDHVVRVTGDCPLIDPHILDAIIIGHLAGQYDYYGLGGEFPDGLDCTVISRSAIEDAAQKAILLSDREHVGPFIERNEEKRFKTGALLLFYGMQDIRLTLDEPSDFQFLSHLFEAEASGKLQLEPHEVLHYLENNPRVKEINAGIERNEGLRTSLERDVRARQEQL